MQGVQFHPESILTTCGHDLLSNFLQSISTSSTDRGRIMEIKAALARIADRKDLSLEEMQDVMGQIMTGAATDAQIGAFLMGLRMKGESLDEITGAVMVMRGLASAVRVSGEHLVDIVGTGGDGANLFNVSTAASFVVAAAGGRVAKHGNRSVSSSSGSADVLEAAGVSLDLQPAQVAACVEKIGVGFMFAPAHHSAMRHAIGPRREMGMRTIFNILGPHDQSRRRQASADRRLRRCAVPAGSGGADAPGRGARPGGAFGRRAGRDQRRRADPRGRGQAGRHHRIRGDAGRVRLAADGTLDGLEVASALESLELIRAALSGAPGDRAERARRVVALNAGAALYVADLQDSIAEGVTAAMRLLKSGKPWLTVEALADFTAAL